MKHLAIVALCAFPLAAHAAPKRKGQGGKKQQKVEAKKTEAKKHIAAATEAHQAEKYDVALTELQAAYDLDPQPDLLYAIGQVQVKLNNCPEAIMSYEKFLESKPATEPASAANEAITTCREQLAAQPPPPPPPDPVPQPAPPRPPESKPFYKDVLGDALVGVGVAAATGGVVFYLGARGKLDDAEKAATYAEHEKLVGEAKSQRNIAVLLGGVGVVAIGVGVWHWTRFGGGGEQRVALVPTTDGGLVTWAGTF
jgi:tetratricopeptide (TPR) repeat protein